MNSILLADGYKLSHAPQYPQGTTLVFSNFTPRGDKYAPAKAKGGVIVFGTQLTMQRIHEHFSENFFCTAERIVYADHPKRILALKKQVLNQVKEELDMYLNTDYDMTHFADLWDLGYLPIEVRALDEGTFCPIKVPMMTIHNTHPEFFWVPNFLETILSNMLWKPVTSATIAHAYRKILDKWAIKTTGSTEGVDFQAHDFSMRGLDSIEATVSSGLGHLTSFTGTDSLPTIWGARKYYDAEGFVAGSVPATEHSVMCAGGKEDELQTYNRLLELYPTGIVSVVSDTWDLWNVITVILPKLKDKILARDGKLVIRPDSGDPVDILCGKSFDKSGSYVGKGTSTYVSSMDDTPEYKGVVELLWDEFGGTINEKGYKVLDPHIGAIYGDSITLERAEEICKRLEAKGFASTNVVFGIGSFTYQYNTRDTYGMAMKATYVERETGAPEYTTKGHAIFKDPITDDGGKKSATGLLAVNLHAVTEEYILKENCSWNDIGSEDNMLKVRYLDGHFYNETNLAEIRERVKYAN